MICNKCKSEVPEDSDFCQYCGTKISMPEILSEETISQETFSVSPSEPVRSGSVSSESFCRKCGGKIDKITKKCCSCGKQYINWRRLIPIAVLSILLCASIGLNAWQFFEKSDLIEETAKMESVISEDSQTNSEQETKIAALNASIRKYEDKAEDYDSLISALNRSNLGYASNNFNASESVIVVKELQNSKKFTLTANWSNGGSVGMHYSKSGVATVSFDNDEWSTSTTMTVVPHSPGVTVVTFDNDVDNSSFSIVIVVMG